MVDIGRLYIIATIEWRTAPIGHFALFQALRHASGAPPGGGGAAKSPGWRRRGTICLRSASGPTCVAVNGSQVYQQGGASKVLWALGC
jgi:hypothetical protein